MPGWSCVQPEQTETPTDTFRHSAAVNLTTYTRDKALAKKTLDFHSAIYSAITPPSYCIILHRIAKIGGNEKHKKTAVSRWKRRFTG